MKAHGHSSSHKWCKRRGLEQQRFYEMAKLRRQFEEILLDHQLLGKQADSSDEEYELPWKEDQRKSHHGNMDDREQKRQELRYLKRHHRQESRKRKILKLAENKVGVLCACPLLLNICLFVCLC